VVALDKSQARVIKPPATAITFGLIRILGPGDKGKRSKVVGPPLEDGTVPDRWAISEFSPQAILAAFGPDQYRADWFDGQGKRISGKVFRVANPPATGGAKIESPRRGRPPSSRREVEEGEPERERDRGRGDPDHISFRELLAMQAEDRRERERAEERADTRRREEAAAQQQRDREFMATMVGALMQTRQQPAAEGDLLRRELQLEIRQGMSRIREELDGREPEEDPDPEDLPQDLGEGMQRVGAAILGELESRAPHLVGELIPQVADWLQKRGFTPSQQLQDQMNARTPLNGRRDAGQS
jgi:hypothetical protein